MIMGIKDLDVAPSPDYHTVVIVRMKNAKKLVDRSVIEVKAEYFRSIYNASRRASEMDEDGMFRTEKMPYITKAMVVERKVG